MGQDLPAPRPGFINWIWAGFNGIEWRDDPVEKAKEWALERLAKFEVGYGGSIIHLSATCVKVRTSVLGKIEIMTFYGAASDMWPLVMFAALSYAYRGKEARKAAMSFFGLADEEVKALPGFDRCRNLVRSVDPEGYKFWNELLLMALGVPDDKAREVMESNGDNLITLLIWSAETGKPYSELMELLA